MTHSDIATHPAAFQSPSSLCLFTRRGLDLDEKVWIHPVDMSMDMDTDMMTL
jgi:hypothetical protein